MITVIDDSLDIAAEIRKIIKHADSDAFLVSPYIEIIGRIRDAITESKKIKLHFLYGNVKIIEGKPELTNKFKSQLSWIKNLPNAQLLFRPHLHTKCYMNEHAVIVTSMNLYDSSIDNNDELGLLITKNDDPNIYSTIREHILNLVENSRNHTKLNMTKIEEDIIASNLETPRTGGTRVIGQYEDKPTFGQRLVKAGIAIKDGLCQVGENLENNMGSITINTDESSTETEETKTTRKEKTPSKGHCLRCNSPIKYNLEKPYCDKDYKIWAQFNNPKYKEKYCHMCGKAYSSSMNSPLCKTCRTK